MTRCTFHAKNPLFRVPLDHVFHSRCFTLMALRRLEYIGSDHFPMCVELSYEPAARAVQPALVQVPGLEEEAEQQIAMAHLDKNVREGTAIPEQMDSV